MPILANMGESVLRRELVSTPAAVPPDSQETTARSTLTTAGTALAATEALALTRWTTLSAPVSRLSLGRLARLSLTLAQSDPVSMEVPAHPTATSISSPALARLAIRVHGVSWTSMNAQGRTLAEMMGSVSTLMEATPASANLVLKGGIAL